MRPENRTAHKHWIPWIKQQLITRGIPTETPLMPDSWAPDYEKFKSVFERYTVNDDTILVGHSCGCAFLVRWLGDTKRAISTLILVAPWKIPDDTDPIRRAFYAYDIDASIRSRVGNIILFTSDNEEEGGKESLRLFHHALGGNVIELPAHGHYTMDDMGTEEFPELLTAIVP